MRCPVLAKWGNRRHPSLLEVVHALDSLVSGVAPWTHHITDTFLGRKFGEMIFDYVSVHCLSTVDIETQSSRNLSGLDVAQGIRVVAVGRRTLFTDLVMRILRVVSFYFYKAIERITHSLTYVMRHVPMSDHHQ